MKIPLLFSTPKSAPPEPKILKVFQFDGDSEGTVWSNLNALSKIITSKGSYRSWKKIVKVWIMMMNEGIFVGHPSFSSPLPLASLALASLALALLALALLALNPLAFAPLKRQNAS